MEMQVIANECLDIIGYIQCGSCRDQMHEAETLYVCLEVKDYLSVHSVSHRDEVLEQTRLRHREHTKGEDPKAHVAEPGRDLHILLWWAQFPIDFAAPNGRNVENCRVSRAESHPGLLQSHFCLSETL